MVYGIVNMKVVDTEVQLSVMFVSVERGAVLVTRGRPERERERGGLLLVRPV